jgi:hypothetical protein
MTILRPAKKRLSWLAAKSHINFAEQPFDLTLRICLSLKKSFNHAAYPRFFLFVVA